MKNHYKLYNVKLRGFYNDPIGSSMVVAADPTTAYNIVLEWLNERDYGFYKDRELKSIELLGDIGEYGNSTTHRLFIQNDK